MIGYQNKLDKKNKNIHNKNDFFAYVRYTYEYQSPENISPQDHQRQFTELIKFIDSQLHN